MVGAKIGHVVTAETRRKISEANKGKTHSEETKNKLSVSSKKRLKNPEDHPFFGGQHSLESKQKMSVSHKKYRCSAETREKISRANKGKKLSEITKQKMREAALKRGHHHKFKNTSIEVALQKELDRREITYETHIPICKTCTPDILFLDEKIAVFADGDHWHSKEFKNGAVWERDRRQEEILRENGWTVLRFWGSEIKADALRCVNDIMVVLQ